jgi:hypothetical protein
VAPSLPCELPLVPLLLRAGRALCHYHQYPDTIGFHAPSKSVSVEREDRQPSYSAPTMLSAYILYSHQMSNGPPACVTAVPVEQAIQLLKHTLGPFLLPNRQPLRPLHPLDKMRLHIRKLSKQYRPLYIATLEKAQLRRGIFTLH